MASEGGGKHKQKRNQGHGKPYERKTTLFGKLKDSVKDLLIPSWLSGSPSVKQGKDVASTSFTKDPVTPITNTVAPEWNRDNSLSNNTMATQYGFSVPCNTSVSNIPDYGSQLSNGEMSMLSNQTSGQSVVAPNVFIGPSSQSYHSGGHTSKHSDTMAKSSFDSSRPSGLFETFNSGYESTPIRPIMVSTGIKTPREQPDAKKQRLWSPEPLRQGKPMIPPTRGKPAFNTSLFGTPSKGDTTIGSTFGDSSFYVGKTCYGGASSSKRKHNSSLPYQSSLPLRKQVKVTKMNKSMNATTSSTAQRILDTLERMSTPLEEAKKIRQDDGAKGSVSFTPSSYRRQTSSVKPITRPLQLPNRGPPTSQLKGTPSIDIAKNRDKSKPVRGDSTTGLAVTQETVASGYDTSYSGSSSCKMKSKKFSQHLSTRQDEEEVAVIPNLRTQFTLPVSSMAPISLSSSKQPSSYPPVTGSSHSTSLQFTFATPIAETRPIRSEPSMSSNEGFKFSSPIHVSQSKSGAAGAEGSTKSVVESAIGAASPHTLSWSPQIKPKSTSPDIGGTSSSFQSYNKWNGGKNEVSPAGMNLPVASTLKKGSVMDILGGNSNSSSLPNSIKEKLEQVSEIKDKHGSSSAPLSEMFKKPAGSWSCDTCMIQNSGDVSKCVACSSLKPCAKISSVEKQPPLSTLFTKPEGSWECSTCMIQNKASVVKCAACSTPKPGASTGSKDISFGNNVPLSTLFKKPEGTWECSTCMIQNSSTSVKCVACETPKPGPAPSSNNSVPLSSLFKKPEGTWDCSTCMVQNKSTSTKCVACETPKPGAKAAMPDTSNNSLAAMFKKPEGSWECETCMVQNTATSLRCIACDASKPGLQSVGIVSKPSISTNNSIEINSAGGFSFNAQSSTTTTTTGSAGFKFGNTSSTVISTPTAPVTGGFSFGSNPSKDNLSANASSSTSSGGFQFGNLSSDKPPDGLQTSSASNSIPSSSLKFDTPALSSNNVSVAQSSALAASKPNGGFQFGSSTTSSNNISNNGFGTQGQNSFAPSASSISSTSSSVTVQDNGISKTSSLSSSAFQFGSSSVDKKSDTFSFGTPTTSSVGQSSPFVFGGAAVSKSSSVGLGMGQSLTASSTPVLNGGIGNGPLDSTATGFGGAAGGFAFGSKPSASQNAKRSVENAEHEGPTAKTPAFGSLSKEPTTNGGFSLNGPFAFGSSQPTQPANPSANAFQFNAGSSTPAAASFNFSASDASAKKNDLQPSFNFSAPGGGANLFQFGDKKSDASAPAPGMFQFGGPSSNPASAMSQPAAPVFGSAIASSNPVGSFNIGAASASSNTQGRTVRKAVRRLKR